MRAAAARWRGRPGRSSRDPWRRRCRRTARRAPRIRCCRPARVAGPATRDCRSSCRRRGARRPALPRRPGRTRRVAGTATDSEFTANDAACSPLSSGVDLEPGRPVEGDHGRPRAGECRPQVRLAAARTLGPRQPQRQGTAATALISTSMPGTPSAVTPMIDDAFGGNGLPSRASFIPATNSAVRCSSRSTT